MKLKNARSLMAVTVLCVSFFSLTFLIENFAPADSIDQSTAKRICQMLTYGHISHPDINDDVSKKIFKEYVKQLDPQKQYLYQSDIDNWKKYETKLDDLLKNGDVNYAYQTFDLFKQRVRERVQVALELLTQPHDFTVDESMTTDYDTLNWATSKAELNERWRKRVKFDLLNLKLANEKQLSKNQKAEDKNKVKEIIDPVERLTKRYRRLLTNLDQTEDFEVFEMFIGALTHSLDPHTSYMSPQTLKDFEIQMRLSLEGIGCSLSSEDGMTKVHRVIPGGAADKHGQLEKDDIILRVGQEQDSSEEYVDIREMRLKKVVQYIRGQAGSKVHLETQKKDGSIVTYTLTRAKIELKESAVKGEIIDSSKRFPGTTGKLGIIHIPSFYRDFDGASANADNFRSASKDVLKVLQDFRNQGGVDGVVIDLRDNGGGSLVEAIEISGLFIEDGPVVQVKNKNGRKSTHSDEDGGKIAYRGPLVVLCNRLSASASEIFAGLIQDSQRGLIIGDKTTHGKGTVQSVLPVEKSFLGFQTAPPNGALKLTINQFYRVNGDSTQNRGVLSDIVLPSILDHGELGEEYLDNALAFDHIPAAEYDRYGLVNSEDVTLLKQRSKDRVAQDVNFKKDLEEIDRFLEREKKKEVTLNEIKLRQEREKDAARDEEDDEQKRGTVDPNEDGPLMRDHHYNNEVLKITMDYLALLKNRDQKTAANQK